MVVVSGGLPVKHSKKYEGRMVTISLSKAVLPQPSKSSCSCLSWEQTRMCDKLARQWIEARISDKLVK